MPRARIGTPSEALALGLKPSGQYWRSQYGPLAHHSRVITYNYILRRYSFFLLFRHLLSVLRLQQNVPQHVNWFGPIPFLSRQLPELHAV